jgi:hypothetical protein
VDRPECPAACVTTEGVGRKRGPFNDVGNGAEGSLQALDSVGSVGRRGVQAVCLLCGSRHILQCQRGPNPGPNGFGTGSVALLNG